MSGRPAIFAPFVPHTKAAVYWTSASVAGRPSMAWSVDFWNGPVNDYPVGYTFWVRCVR